MHGEDDNYQLFYGDYSGDEGDAFGYSSSSYLNATYFSIIDQANDRVPSGHCAQLSNAGFWYSNCGRALLNNPYYAGGTVEWGRSLYGIHGMATVIR